jgi:Flp pilus assembly protein TadG
MRQISSKNGVSRAYQEGSVIVELALMLPVLAIFILGATDLGILIREHQVLQNAAREGARFSALPKNKIDPLTPSATQVATAQSIRDRVINYLAQENITVASTGCTESPANQWNCGAITIRQEYPIVSLPTGGVLTTDHGSAITVTYNRSFLFSGGSLFQFNSVSLNGSAVFHNLYGN